MQEALEEAKKEITPDNMKKIYTFLEKKNPEPVVYLMEALVGLMRGQKRADPVSVELYTKKHEGFMIGLNRVDAKQLNVNTCQDHLNALQDKYDKILGSEEFVLFRPYRNVLSKLCLLALLVKDETEIEELIENKKKKIENN